MNGNAGLQESVSALVDGQVREGAFAEVVAHLENNDSARGDWDTYHLVGDVMRHGELALVQARDERFLAAIHKRLTEGATPDLRGRHIEKAVLARESANQSTFYWKLTAGFASFVAVAALSWQMMIGLSQTTAAPQLSRTESTPSPELAQIMIRDPQLDKLLEAHRLNGDISALQLPAGFMRSATYDKLAR